MTNFNKRPCGRFFTLKTYSSDLYIWSPDCPTYRKNQGFNANSIHNKPYYCSANAGSQGVDWISTYCYDFISEQRLAYVECDYVE